MTETPKTKDEYFEEILVKNREIEEIQEDINKLVLAARTAKCSPLKDPGELQDSIESYYVSRF